MAQRKTRAAEPTPTPTMGPIPNMLPALDESVTRVLFGDGPSQGEGAGAGGATGALGFFP